MRIWGKLFQDNHLLRDCVSEQTGDRSRTEKVMAALGDICNQLDLQQPIWLKSNIREFQKVAKTRFRQDSFIEEIPFDYLEFHVIEEDDF